MKPKRTILAVVSVFAALAIAGDFRASAAEAAKKDDAKPAPAAAAVEMAPIDLKLPAPYFGGTPLTYGNEHYEEPSPVPRAPFQAPKGAAVLSQGKPVTSSCANPVFGKLPMITDGEKGYQTDFVTELSTGTQWVQIDLGEACEVYAVALWHFHAAERVYFDVIVRTADDADFKQNVQTLYNSDYDNSSGLGIGKDKEYLETYEGRLASGIKDGKGTTGRYVRLYSKGNTTDEANHYVEVEVWGKPAGKK